MNVPEVIGCWGVSSLSSSLQAVSRQQREAMAKAMIRVRNDFFFILMILNDSSLLLW